MIENSLFGNQKGKKSMNKKCKKYQSKSYSWSNLKVKIYKNLSFSGKN